MTASLSASSGKMALCYICENAEAEKGGNGLCKHCTQDDTILVGTRRAKPKLKTKK